MENGEINPNDKVYLEVLALRKRLTIVLVIVILLMIAMGGLIWGMLQQFSRLDRSLLSVNSTVVAAVSTAAPTAEAFNPYYAIPVSVRKDGMTLGNANAPVTVEMFSDYQCPFCKRANDTINHTLIEQYVQAGKVKFTYHPFNFLGEESLLAANAAYCAIDQNRFWEFKEALFANQMSENQGGFKQDRLIALGRFAGIQDMDKFSACIQKTQYKQQVLDDNALGQTRGIQSVPAYFVNGEDVKDGDIFKIIDTHLSK